MPLNASITNGEARLGPAHAPVIPLILIGAGMYLTFFGVHYWGTDVKWPSDPVKNVLQGKGLPGTGTKTTAQDILTADITAAGSSTSTSSSSSPGGNTGAGSQSAAQNQNTAKLLTVTYGWNTGQQWDDLVKLWNQESGWSNTAKNPTSGAYGIAQALPPTKYPAAGQEPPVGTSDPTAQITWGLQYIAQRYGNPVAAWSHEVQNNWY